MYIQPGPLFLIIMLVLIVLAVILGIFMVCSNSSKDKRHLDEVKNLSAKVAGSGYVLTWDEVPNATSYNLYLFDKLMPDDSLPPLDKATHCVYKIQSSYYLDGRFQNFSELWIAVVAVMETPEGDLRSETCFPHLLNSNLCSVNAPVLHCTSSDKSIGSLGFQADEELCYQREDDDTVYIQWFPVSGATGYNVYENELTTVSPTNYKIKTMLSATSYQYNSDVLDSDSCWSFVVTAVDSYGRESEPSQIFTTCSPP